MSDQHSPPDIAQASNEQSEDPKESDTVEGPLDRLNKEVAAYEAEQRRPGKKLTIEMRLAERTLFFLKTWGQDVFGLKIYRLTYDDDAAWQKFKEMLDAKTRRNLTQKEALPEGETLLTMLDWAVEDNKERWDNASLAEVRKHFLNSPEAASPGQRGRTCIAVDAESLQSVMDAKEPVPFSSRHRDSPFVKVIGTLLRPDNSQLAQQQEPGKSGEESKGSAEDEVRYMKVDPSTLLPFFYDNLRVGFDEIYYGGPRPPYVWTE
ncbi:hypothetical protein SLS58_001431 [Diplodia intermedia]|uniref:Uncharacterized protein n=1 Tax=Diplodia intermedia TaxID=856260 RepID=A0ABR3U258_9PEZI